jgi:chemotaxis family two-component system response regulator Rcp1
MMNPQDSRPVEILLVEDSPSDAALAMEAFRSTREPNRLNHVEDGIQAMEYLRRHGSYRAAPRPDLVVLDLNLPRKDGREVLAEVKADPDLKTIPVIVLTTSRSEKDVTLSYELHANCFIVKPIDFSQFMAIVESIIAFWRTVVTLPRNY